MATATIMHFNWTSQLQYMHNNAAAEGDETTYGLFPLFLKGTAASCCIIVRVMNMMGFLHRGLVVPGRP